MYYIIDPSSIIYTRIFNLTQYHFALLLKKIFFSERG